MQLRRAIQLTVTFLVISLPVLPPLLEIGMAWGAGTAEIWLIDVSASATQTGDNEWELDKTGSLSGNIVTWNITATNTATTSGQLVLRGQFKVSNTGNGPGTIGNILVNLQTKAGTGNSWTTRSTDVANATDGDAATTANIHKAASSENKSTFTENSASGALEFMDATNNTVWSLVPPKTIGAGETITLLFSASFDNNVLNIAAGTSIRAEVIVSFGNATVNGNSTANVDINGNGQIDSDEARIRSVPSRITVQVPAPVNGNATPTLTDTLDDIAATGDVTFSNVNINLGATSGTVTATVDGGVAGGSITNCAHLTSPSTTVNSGGYDFQLTNGVDLQACSTIAVVGTDPPCTPGTAGCGWSPGDLSSFNQLAWGSTGAGGAALLAASYNTVYAATGGVLEVGIAGTAGFSIRFGSASFVTNYLPATGPAAALNGDVVNPTTTSSGLYGGEVTALALNVDFSAAGLLSGALTTDLGDLNLCNVAGLPNMSVSAFLALAEDTLGGANTGYAPTSLVTIASSLNSSFLDGTPSSFAQDHLVIGACP